MDTYDTDDFRNVVGEHGEKGETIRRAAWIVIGRAAAAHDGNAVLPTELIVEDASTHPETDPNDISEH